MPDRILVTGGAGYIGSTLVPMLLEAGHDVHVVDSFMYQENSLGGVMHHDRLSVTVGDVRDRDTMGAALAQADIIIPLAALVGAPACSRDPWTATSVNHTAIMDMLDMVSAHQVVVMPTTNSAYGTGNDDHFCDETSPLRPISQYAREKVEIEQALMERENSVSLRLATVFGMSPRMRLDLLVNDFVNRALRDRFIVLFESSFYRNYIHVRDVARVFMFAVEHLQDFTGEIFNVGLSSANITKRDLCERIREQVPAFEIMEAPLAKDPDQRNYIVSNAKIEGLGYSPQVTLDEGIRELVKGIPTLRHLRNANA